MESEASSLPSVVLDPLPASSARWCRRRLNFAAHQQDQEYVERRHHDEEDHPLPLRQTFSKKRFDCREIFRSCTAALQYAPAAPISRSLLERDQDIDSSVLQGLVG